MKKYANIVLLAILAALFYKTPSFLMIVLTVLLENCLDGYHFCCIPNVR